MARRSSKAETVALGIIGIIAMVIYMIVSLVNAIFDFVITYWLSLLLIAVICLGLIIWSYYNKYKNLSINIYKFNLEADTIRNNIVKDYQSLSNDDELVGMFDNAIAQFPSDTFLDFYITGDIEDRIISSNRYMEIDTDILLKYKMPKIYYFAKLDKKFILPEISNDVLPADTFPNVLNININVDLYSNPFPQDYGMFVKIVSNKFKFSSIASQNICIWKLLLTRAELHYCNYWDSNFRQYFETANSAELSDLVGCYCDINYINHLDKYNVAMFSYFIAYSNNDPDIYSLYVKLKQLINSELEQRKLKSFEKRLLNSSEHTDVQKQRYSIKDTDLMNGSQFENFIALLFRHLGYNATVTSASGDQGIDIIAENGSEKIGIQAKRYSNVVSNSAIQEVVAGIAHYKCNKGMVVTNNSFTKSAVTLAKSNDIILWDRHKLENMINEVL